MAKIISKPTIEVKFWVELTGEEAGALDALFGYDLNSFLKVFYKELGEAYLKPHEAGLRSLHVNRGAFSSILAKQREAKKR